MVALRVILGLTSGYEPGVFGFNEAFYQHVAKGYTRSLMPNVDGHPFYDTPPLLTVLEAPFVKLWPHWEGASRVPVLGAFIWLVVVAKRFGGWQKAAIVAGTPWVWFWMGNNSTDPLLTLFACWLALEASLGRTRFVGLIVAMGLLSKQTFVLASPLVLFWPKPSRVEAWVNAATGVMCVCAWWALQYVQNPADVAHAFLWNATQRASPFGAWREVAVIGVLAGSGGVLLAMLARTNGAKERWTLYTAALFVVFALVDAPRDHFYYTLPGIALLGLAAPSLRDWPVWARVGQAAASTFVLGLLIVAGGLVGDTGVREAAHSIPAGAAVAGMVSPQVRFYGFDPGPWHPGCQLTTMTLCGSIMPGCDVLERYGRPLPTLYLETCR